jgi:hypothetical protein
MSLYGTQLYVDCVIVTAHPQDVRDVCLVIEESIADDITVFPALRRFAMPFHNCKPHAHHVIMFARPQDVRGVTMYSRKPHTNRILLHSLIGGASCWSHRGSIYTDTVTASPIHRKCAMSFHGRNCKYSC